MVNKFLALFSLSFFGFFISCATTEQKTQCHCPTVKTVCPNGQQIQSIDTQPLQNQNLSPSQTIALASDLFNHGEFDEAFNLLNSVPDDSKDLQYQNLRRDVVNKIVINTRYKVRTLYEKSLQQTGAGRRDLLLQCKGILQATIKNYPDYENIYAIKNSLKQIERELAKK